MQNKANLREGRTIVNSLSVKGLWEMPAVLLPGKTKPICPVGRAVGTAHPTKLGG
jgi:hypothetical protein